MNTANNNYIKVIFPLHPDKDGWPPVAAEAIWAQRVAEDKYCVDSIPFYVKGIACNDLISIIEKDNSHYFNRLLKDSGHQTIRVYLNVDAEDAFKKSLRGFGAEIEKYNDKFFAIDVPPRAEKEKIAAYLSENEQKGVLEYEEGKINKRPPHDNSA